VSTDEIAIEVRDDGAGIPAKLLPHVFELFVQGERTLDRSQGGLGIGLAVVKRPIEMHGGESHLTSPGLRLGSTFTLRLPRLAAPGVTVVPEVGLTASHRRVLIVDDNADAADSLAMLLVLEAAPVFAPDLVLLDIGLPQINGYEVARRLRADPRLPGLRLVALTGHGQSQDRERALTAGFDAHLVKPPDLAALTRILAGTNDGRTL